MLFITMFLYDVVIFLLFVPYEKQVRDRPFNLQGVMVFCFVQNFFFGQHKSQNIHFFCRAKRNFFFQNSTLGYMTKILNQIIFFFLHQNQNIFFSNIGNQNIFLEKKHNSPPPLPFKLNGRSLIVFFTILLLLYVLDTNLCEKINYLQHVGSFLGVQVFFPYNEVDCDNIQCGINQQCLENTLIRGEQEC